MLIDFSSIAKLIKELIPICYSYKATIGCSLLILYCSSHWASSGKLEDFEKICWQWEAVVNKVEKNTPITFQISLSGNQLLYIIPSIMIWLVLVSSFISNTLSLSYKKVLFARRQGHQGIKGFSSSVKLREYHSCTLALYEESFWEFSTSYEKQEAICVHLCDSTCICWKSVCVCVNVCVVEDTVWTGTSVSFVSAWCSPPTMMQSKWREGVNKEQRG